MLVGYARVSSAGQSLEIQRDELIAAGCEKLFEEKRSGKAANNRPELQDALRFVREGDTLIVTRLDRLARSVLDLRNIIGPRPGDPNDDSLAARRVGFRCLQQPLDTTGSMGKLMLNILAAFAEFENDLRRDRQQEGIEKAKAKGTYKGRTPTLDAAAIRARLAAGERPVDIARDLNIARSSVYRLAAPTGT